MSRFLIELYHEGQSANQYSFASWIVKSFLKQALVAQRANPVAFRNAFGQREEVWKMLTFLHVRNNAVCIVPR